MFERLLDEFNAWAAPRWVRWALLAGSLLALGLWIYSCAVQHRGQVLQVAAEVHHQVAEQQAAAADAHDVEATVRAPQLAADAAEVARLRSEVARLRSPAPPAPIPVPDPAAPPVDLAPLVAGQDELIRAQDRQIQDLGAQVNTLTLARDSWRRAAEEERIRGSLQEAALRAQLAATRAASWKGRIEGFAVGIGAGYLAGRIR